MKQAQRFEQITTILHNAGSVVVANLVERLGVSEDTVRRDLRALEKQGHLRRVHGGATRQGAFPLLYDDRLQFARDQKIELARRGLERIEPNQTLLIDGGTTHAELVRQLPRDLPLTIATNSLPLAFQLTDYPAVQLLFLGGEVFKQSKVTLGAAVIEQLRFLRVDLFFLGAAAVHREVGIQVPHYQEAQVKRAMQRAAARTVVLSIREKLTRTEPHVVCPLEEVELMVAQN